MSTTELFPSPAATLPKVSEIANGALLAIGDCNHDFHFERDEFNGVISTRVIATGKPGRGSNCSFGSLNYFAGYARREPSRVNLTPDGHALVNASYAELRAVNGVWGQAYRY